MSLAAHSPLCGSKRLRSGESSSFDGEVEQFYGRRCVADPKISLVSLRLCLQCGTWGVVLCIQVSLGFGLTVRIPRAFGFCRVRQALSPLNIAGPSGRHGHGDVGHQAKLQALGALKSMFPEMDDKVQ